MGSSQARALLATRLVALAVIASAVLAFTFVRSAEAANYKMLLCAGGVGLGEATTETNTTSPGNPEGIYNFENHCGPAGDPAGGAAYVRIADNQGGGKAGEGAYGRYNWNAPEGVQIASAGGYTREPETFNEGWRARYWVEGFDASQNTILLQGAGVESNGVARPRTTTFAPHLWPFPALGGYRRFSFELECVRPQGCDRQGSNVADSNTMLLTLTDPTPPTIAVAAGALSSGAWTKGVQPVRWATTEAGSGLRYERVKVDGAERIGTDYRTSCDLGSSEASGEYAREFEPCPRGGPFPHSGTIDTTPLADGAHSLAFCAQDYSQAASGGEESCETRTIHTDNNPPAAPVGLAITSANPARYESTFSASWSLAADPGSPIVAVRYWITDAAGNIVVPSQTVAATNPSGLPAITGPSAAGAYTLNVALQDEVGFVGPTATAAIPHDTTPPAAPQDISVTSPSTSRASKGFDVQWTNIVDAGSPINAAHYEIEDSAGNVVVGEQTVSGENPQAIPDLATPQRRGSYRLLVWLSDAEGNVGSPVAAPLAFDCVRSEVKGARSLSATFGQDNRNQILVGYGSGATLKGRLEGSAGRLPGAPICVYTRIVSQQKERFIGVAVTNGEGEYQFPVPAGASRQIIVENRPGQRTVRSTATMATKAHPSIELVSKSPAHNGSEAVFKGRLAGPETGSVPIALQVRDGEHWITFSTVSTAKDGSYEVGYGLSHVRIPVTFAVRTVMLRQHNVPYHPGSSEVIDLRVRP